MESVNQRQSPHAMVGDQADLCTENMLQYDRYKYESQNVDISHLGWRARGNPRVGGTNI